MDLMRWDEIPPNHSNGQNYRQAPSHHQHHHMHQQHPMNHYHNPHMHNYNLHLDQSHSQDSSAPTIKNHSVTHFGGYLFTFGGYDGRRNHMTLLVYSIAENRWIRPVHTISVAAAPPQAGPMMAGLNGAHANGNGAGFPNNAADNPVYQQQPLHQDGQQQQQPQHQQQQQLLHANHLNNLHMNRISEGDNMNHAADDLDGNGRGGNANMGRGGGEGLAGNNNNGPSNNNNNNNNALSSSTFWVSGTFPPGRNGHSATLVIDDEEEDDEHHPESGRIFVLGGWLGTGPLAASDMHVLDISNGGRQLRWYQPTVKGSPPGAANMHSADYVKSQRSIYVFRGGNGRDYLNDLHALHVDSLQWRRVETTGAIPQQRANHSSSILGDELFIFGGWNGTERLNDIHILDTKTNVWTCPHVGGVLPHPRAGMTLTALRGRLFLFGGSGTSAKCFQDLQILDREKMAWLDVSMEQDQIKSSGGSSVPVPPGPTNQRYEEDLVANHRYGNGSYDNMMPHYDENGQHPFGNYSDQTMGDDHRMMVDQYGRASNNSRNDPWRNRTRYQNHVINPNDEDSLPSVLVQGRGPGRRAGHTATAVNRKIFVFGGSCGSDYLNDFFVLDTDPPPRAVVTESNSLDLMKRRLRHFFNDEEFADVVFLVQGQRVYGHKMVLSIVSDCFRAMFNSGSGFREAAEAEIVIPDCTHASFLALMEYIYTGSLPKSLCLDGNAFHLSADGQSNQQGGPPTVRSSSSVVSESSLDTSGASSSGNNAANGSNMDSSQLSRLVELLELADRFFLDHLKQICETLLRGAVNVDTVDFLTSVAQKTNSTQLLEICQHFSRNRV